MEFSIKDVFDKVSQRMRIDFEESRDALNHPTLKGDAAEEIVRDFFKKYLPKNLTITSGIVIDSEGHFSKQIDIIICDAFKSPVFYEKKDIRVIPIETVYAVIEVKSVLKGGQISSICDNMNSIKKMKKQAFYIPSGAIIKKYKFYDSYTDHFPVLYDTPSGCPCDLEGRVGNSRCCNWRRCRRFYLHKKKKITFLGVDRCNCTRFSACSSNWPLGELYESGIIRFSNGSSLGDFYRTSTQITWFFRSGILPPHVLI